MNFRRPAVSVRLFHKIFLLFIIGLDNAELRFVFQTANYRGAVFEFVNRLRNKKIKNKLNIRFTLMLFPAL
jgi:hypothetical protein